MKDGIFKIANDGDAFDGVAELRGENILVIRVRGQGCDDHDLYCDLLDPQNCKTVFCGREEVVWLTRYRDLFVDTGAGYVEFFWIEDGAEWFVEGELPALQVENQPQ